MLGFRFYQEFTNTTKKHPTGNVIAVSVDNKGRPEYLRARDEPMVEVISAVFDTPNSPVEGSSASMGYLRSHTKRISEAQARKIHPELFRRLDN